MTNCPKHYIKQPGLEYELSVLCSFSSFLFLMQLVTYGYSKFTIWKKENIEWTLILEWKRGNRVESFWRSLVLRFCSFNRKKEAKVVGKVSDKPIFLRKALVIASWKFESSMVYDLWESIANMVTPKKRLVIINDGTLRPYGSQWVMEAIQVFLEGKDYHKANFTWIMKKRIIAV